MQDPAALLSERLTLAITAAFGADFGDTDPMLRSSQHSDFQANVAMPLAKRLGAKPRDLATKILEHLEVSDLCEKVEIAGPGFINLSLKATTIANALNQLLNDGVLTPNPARKLNVIIDYSSPNVAKEMHVGHLRSTIIGDALSRVFGALGHTVLRQNHIGDWGTPFGMLIEHLLDLGESQGTDLLSMGELNQFYKDARVKFDSDESFADRARARVVKLQALDEATLKLWSLLVEKSSEYFSRVYEKLGILLTRADIRGESFYNPFLEDTVRELTEKGIARTDQDALCVFPEGFVGREGEPLPLIIRKKEGGYGYATTDLAAIRQRVETEHADRILYVVGSPQQQHFAMVFKTAEAAGWLTPEVAAEHVGFGQILGADKKMFKTRSGDTVRLIDLVDEAIARAQVVVAEKNPELGADKTLEVARQIGIGALKYADLSNDRVKDYVFDYDRMLSFEGNTGPYLQYAHARICSIFRRANLSANEAKGPVQIEAPQERALALHLLSFGSCLQNVAQSLELQRLCTYLYDLATLFMGFYEHCPVLKADTEQTRDSRLALAATTATTLKFGLNLLGIEAPERM